MKWSGLHSRPPAPSGSRNLLAPSSAPSLPALFHAGSALGVTLQSFLPRAQPCAVSSAVPLVAFHPPSGFCSTRESATRSSCLGWHRARSSPGSFPLQGVHSLGAGPAFTGPPLVRLLLRTKRPSGAPLQGLSRRRPGLVSLETADPPGVCGLLVVMPVRATPWILESPPKAPGVRHRPLVSPSSNPRVTLPEPSITSLSASPPQRLCRSTPMTLGLPRCFVNSFFCDLQLGPGETSARS